MYQEKQKFQQKIVPILLYILLALSFILLFGLLMQDEAGWYIAFVPVGVLGTLLVLFHLTTLETKIDTVKICFRFRPLLNNFKCIFKDEIAKISVGPFDPVSDFGGWGIRYGRKSRAFTTSGHYGIKIQLINGKSVFIGTQHPNQVYKFLLENDFKIDEATFL